VIGVAEEPRPRRPPAPYPRRLTRVEWAAAQVDEMAPIKFVAVTGEVQEAQTPITVLEVCPEGTAEGRILGPAEALQVVRMMRASSEAMADLVSIINQAGGRKYG